MTEIRANHDELTYWIARLFAHFPQRDSEKDGIFISDITRRCLECRVSLMAVVAVYDEIWQETSRENVWIPPSGEILRRIIDKSKYYDMVRERVINPKKILPKSKPIKRITKPNDPFNGKKWKDFTDDDKKKFIDDYFKLPKKIRSIFVMLYKSPDELVLKCELTHFFLTSDAVKDICYSDVPQINYTVVRRL